MFFWGLTVFLSFFADSYPQKGRKVFNNYLFGLEQEELLKELLDSNNDPLWEGIIYWNECDKEKQVWNKELVDREK